MGLTFRSRWRRVAGAALALSLLAGACGSDDDDPDASDDGGTEEPGVTDVGDEGSPVPGGSLVYALEAENSGGWCLPEAQLAIAGIQVARTIYDTLTAPDEDGEIKPFLAESVESNDTADVWTIKLREGVKFHDGTDLTAEVVKNNLDAYRGAYPARSPQLFIFVFSNIDTVEVVDPLTVEVKTKTPWPAFPWFLFSSGRVGMLAQAQLDNADTCDRDLIGTGPFKLDSWTVNQSFKASKFEDYWDTDDEGNQLPYLNSIEYRPVPDGAQRSNLLESGEIQATHQSGSIQIDNLRSMGDAINLIESNAYGEVGYFMLNAAPESDAGPARIFNNPKARRAAALALDRERINNVRALGIPEIASGPFAPGNVGFLEDSGYPEYNLEEAKALVAEVEEETGQEFRILLASTTDPETVATSDLLEEMLTDAGIKVDRNQFEQAQLINNALAGNFDMIQWRNHPGGDPDTQYNWWATGSPVNFGRITDPDMQALLDAGRTETDPAAREEIYEDLNRLFAERLYNLWQSYTTWAIGTHPSVHGLLGPSLPDGSGPFPGLATGHPVSGVWIAE